MPRIRLLPRPGSVLRWGFRLFIFIVAFTSFMFTEGDVRTFTPAEKAGAGYLFSIPSWELSNFGDKWINRIKSFFGFGAGDDSVNELITGYTIRSDEINAAEGRLARALASPGTPAEEIERLENHIESLREQRRDTRDELEERLEAEISSSLEELGFGGALGSLWPPVDFRLETPPHVFVTSRRDRIERLDSVLLSPQITGSESEEVERELEEDSGLSGIVLPLGGVATYPTFVRDDRPLVRTLELATHEWLHAYLFFHPLGQNIGSSSDMNTLNETIASLFGEELGIATWERVTGERHAEPDSDGTEEDEDAFDFDKFMRETRLRTDELLEEGDVAGAEAYMEARRLELQEHGIFIRKLNQAWFAFHGTYADSPASVSPIGSQVDELRSLAGDAGELVRRTRGVSSYDEFLQVLEEARTRAGSVPDARP